MIAPAVAFSSIWRSLQRLVRRSHFRDRRTAFLLTRHRRAVSCSSMKAFCVHTDRPTRPPLLRFCALQRLLTALRYPGLPASGRSRCGFWAGFLTAPPEVFRQQMEPTSLPLRYFAVSSASGHRSMRGCDVRSPRVMHRAFLVNLRDVPLPAECEVFRGSAGTHQFRRRSWALIPSQCCSCSGDFGAFPLLFPHMPSMNFHLGYFSEGPAD